MSQIPQPKFKIGSGVDVLHTPGCGGVVVEHRGPLGPGGAQIYRLGLGNGSYVEVREDQLVSNPRRAEQQELFEYADDCDWAYVPERNPNEPDHPVLTVLGVIVFLLFMIVANLFFTICVLGY